MTTTPIRLRPEIIAAMRSLADDPPNIPDYLDGLQDDTIELADCRDPLDPAEAAYWDGPS
jgi:hypothetical protein